MKKNFQRICFGLSLNSKLSRVQSQFFLHRPVNCNLIFYYLFFFIQPQGLRPCIPVNCPEEYAQLMRDCWQENPALRPSFSTVLNRLDALRRQLITQGIFDNIPKARNFIVPSLESPRLSKSSQSVIISTEKFVDPLGLRKDSLDKAKVMSVSCAIPFQDG